MRACERELRLTDMICQRYEHPEEMLAIYDYLLRVDPAAHRLSDLSPVTSRTPLAESVIRRHDYLTEYCTRTTVVRVFSQPDLMRPRRTFSSIQRRRLLEELSLWTRVAPPSLPFSCILLGNQPSRFIG